MDMRKALLAKKAGAADASGSLRYLDDAAGADAAEARVAFRKAAEAGKSAAVSSSSKISPPAENQSASLPPRVPEMKHEFGIGLDDLDNTPADWKAIVESELGNELKLGENDEITASSSIISAPPRKSKGRGVVGRTLRDHDSDTEDASSGTEVSSYDSVSEDGDFIDGYGLKLSEDYSNRKKSKKKKGKKRKSKSRERQKAPSQDTEDSNRSSESVDIEMRDKGKRRKDGDRKKKSKGEDVAEKKKKSRDRSKQASEGEENQVERKKKKKKKPKFLLASSNMLSRLLYLWVFKLIIICNKTRDRDMPNLGMSLRPSESAKMNGDALDTVWKEEVARKGDKASLYRALNRAFGARFVFLAVWKVFWAVFTWFGSYAVLKWLIEYTESRDDLTTSQPPIYIGHLSALGLFLCSMFASICFHQLMGHSIQIGVQTRAALMVLIYRKSLRLSYIKGGVGDIVNLISNESNRIAEACVNWHFMWSAAVECLIVVVLVAFDIGFSAIPAMILIIFVILPLQYFLAYKASSISYQTTDLITKRVHLMSEILTAIKLIKFYAWEPFYKSKLSTARNFEVKQLKRSLLLKIATFMVVFIAPVLATLCCLVSFYLFTHGTVKASVVFTLLSLFNTLRYPLVLLPQAVRSISGASTALKRLEEFFTQPEVDPIPPPKKDVDMDSNILMNFQNAWFKWDGDLDHPHIEDLNLQLRRKQLIAVVGDVGSGKSLLAAIMGQIKMSSGGDKPAVADRFGTCGYVPQEPWLINASIQDNILFGLDFDEKKYSDVVRLCGLTRDLMLLSKGDQSFVSELNLSAAQSQRLSLARCLYHDPDVVLLDDTLSDFDQGTAKRLFKEAIRNYIVTKKKKAVVLVTQQKQFLSECDLILVIKGGKVVERGTFSELKQKKVNFSAWVTEELPIDDDPTGLLEKVNEIRLEPSQPARVLHSKNLPSAVHTPSPLATAKVITMNDATYNSINAGQFLNPEDANQLTIQHLQQLNASSVQFESLNEQTISKMIELNQLSVLTSSSGPVAGSSATGSAPPAIGASRNRPRATPVNFENQDVVKQAMDANQLTVHSSFDSSNMASETDSMIDSEGGGGITLQRLKKESVLSGYVMYLNLANGRAFGIIIIATFFIVHGLRFLSDAWLTFYIDRTGSFSDSIYLGVYGGLTLTITFGVLIRGFMISYAVLKKSIALHEKVLEAVLHAPMSFYDITPVGQILSNFARHLYMVDDFLPEAALQVLAFSPILVGTIILVCIVISWFWATLPLYFIPAYFLIAIAWKAEEKLKLLEGMNKAPMFSHLSATLEGLFSIRLYHAEARFDAFNRSLIDADHKALYSLMLVKAVTALYLDLIVTFFIYFACMFVVSFDVSPSFTGLAVTNSLQLLLFVQWLVRMAWDVHSSMSSVSAVIQFSEHIPREALEIIRTHRPPTDWPSAGNIEYKNVVLRYNRYGVAVLKSVSFRIHSGEKIGIIGRSGSGKTTLLVALLRIVELTHGEILIDGINTGSIGLRDLRSRIAVIPQEPVLLSGTIRSNLDPNLERSDEEIWKALHSAHLGDKIREMPLKIDTPVAENGKTFTQGERQLFCIARAILLNSSIVVLDEPATAVDPETDQLVQTVMFENFATATVIILASRFNLIMQVDKIMVMESGRVTEFDSPLALLENPRSKLSLMVAQSAELDLTELKSSATHKRWGSDNSGRPSRTRQTSVALNGQLHPLAVSSLVPDAQSTVSTVSSNHSDSKMPRSLEDLFVPLVPQNSEGRLSPTQESLQRQSKTKLTLDISRLISSKSAQSPNAAVYEKIGSASSSITSAEPSRNASQVAEQTPPLVHIPNPTISITPVAESRPSLTNASCTHSTLPLQQIWEPEPRVSAALPSVRTVSEDDATQPNQSASSILGLLAEVPENEVSTQEIENTRSIRPNSPGMKSVLAMLGQMKKGQ